MKFVKYNDLVKKNFNKTQPAYVVKVEKDILWETYLNAYPEEERQEHNCNCCKSFVRNFGGLVQIIDGKKVSLWDTPDAKGSFANVSKAMKKLVQSAEIENILLTEEKNIGIESNIQTINTEGKIETIRWYHLSLGDAGVSKHISNLTIDTERAEVRTAVQTLKRSFEEITQDSVNVVLELIATDAIYRGSEFKSSVEVFKKAQNEYLSLTTEGKELYLWSTNKRLGPVSKMRNTAIGTLLVNISEGVELDKAVGSFEKIMAPQNYKRPTPIITARMVQDAEKRIKELGFENSLGRRLATKEDLHFDNILFVDNNIAKEAVISGLLGDLKAQVDIVNPKSFSKLQELDVDKFIQDVLPTSSKVEVYFDGRNENNLVSLIAPKVKNSASMFKWKDNNFSWSYNNAVADSMREKVAALGGRIDGVFRFTHSWNHTGQNQSLMDLHVFLPTHKQFRQDLKQGSVEIHDHYGNNNRVGWNNRNHRATKGTQDVDFTSAPGPTFVPIENITFPDLALLPEGEYICKIHNWDSRMPNNTGYKAEIEFDGQIHTFEREAPLKHKEWDTVATVVLKDGKFSIKDGKEFKPTVRTIWGLETYKFHQVNFITLSPNYWKQETGNKHLFFFIDKAVNEGEIRGYFNEFLSSDLDKDRKVFEALGGRSQVEQSDNQLSGIGFSSTTKGEMVIRVTTNTNTTKLFKIKF